MRNKVVVSLAVTSILLVTIACGMDANLVDDVVSEDDTSAEDASQGNDISEWLAGEAKTYEFEDRADDEVVCDDGSATSDASVDIFDLSVREINGGVEVKVHMARSAEISAKDYSLSIQARIGRSTKDGGEGYQVGIYEFHGGEPSRIGRLETVELIEDGTEGDISVDGDVVTFFFPETTIKEGDTVTAQAFHLSSSADRRTCDATEAFPLE